MKRIRLSTDYNPNNIDFNRKLFRKAEHTKARRMENGSFNIVILYASESGNTEALANFIAEELLLIRDSTRMKINIELNHVGRSSISLDEVKKFKNRIVSVADLLIVGTYTWDGSGSLPQELDHFLSVVGSIFIRSHVSSAVFGTGETQWGEENYCAGADKTAAELASPHEVLKIEHRPLPSDSPRINSWLLNILDTYLEGVSTEYTPQPPAESIDDNNEGLW